MPKPQTVLCYICGREFGSYSINVHERQCAKRWESQRTQEKDTEQKRKTSTAKDRTQDIWVEREVPSIKVSSSQSMIDIRLPNGTNGHTNATDSEKELMHSFRPMTVSLKDRGKSNGSLSAGESEINLTTSEVPKILRPGTTVLQQRYTSPLLPNKMSPMSIMKAKSGEHVRKIEGTPKNALDTETEAADTLVQPRQPRKYSAPESIQTTPCKCASPESSTSSQASSDCPETPSNELETPNFAAPRFRSSKNPSLLVCYICGNEFGSKSLKIHEPQCLKKWKLANPRYYSRKGSHGGMFKADSVSSLNFKENGLKSSRESSSLPHDFKSKTSPKSASCENLLDSGSTMRGNLQSTNSLQALKELSKSHSRLYISKKPKMEPCYICGKEFIKHSLEVHEKQCKKKWDAIKFKNEKEERKKLLATNALTSKRHSVNLPVTFKVGKAEDRTNNNLEKTQQDNDSSNKAEDYANTSPTKEKTRERKSSTVTCYICGRPYGTASISIHEKQCQKKWEAETAKKEQEQQLRPRSGMRKTKARPKSFML